jgi:sterol desaturase/sphingolipid hydroxylase (fatty acid hydroxylase superfamily)
MTAFIREVFASSTTLVTFVTIMGAVALVERLIPFRARGPRHLAHLRPNLVLTAITLSTSVLLNALLVIVLIGLEARGFGLLRLVALHPIVAGILVVIALDLATYAAHVAMHHVPALWRFHRVHHADAAMDVTTSLRQHPGESLFRYLCLAAGAILLGASPAAFAAYRIASALNALVEHANLRMPLGLERVISLLVVTPNMHRVHHSRRVVESDSNYGNILSVFDRLLSTFTPIARARDVDFGLDGFDDPGAQTTTALLTTPFRSAALAPAAQPRNAL